MPATPPSPLVSELGTERRIVIVAALSLTLLSLVFRNDRALLLGAGAPANRDASAFTAVVAPPAVASGPTISGFGGQPGNRGTGRNRAPGVATQGSSAVTPAFVAPAPVTPSSAAAGTPLAVLPVDLATGNGATRSYTPQLASFIGLPGGVIFGSGGTTPTDPTDPTTPTNPTDPTTPTNPTNPTNPTDPTTPTNPTDPTTPTNPTDPTDPGTPPVVTPDPGPGAVPEPVSWALMILGLGVVGASLRRRRSAEAARPELSAA